jgi:DNA-binding GntR family transcriptional regulator
VANQLRKRAGKLSDRTGPKRDGRKRTNPSRLQVHTAKQIIALIRYDGLPSGHHLREEALAKRFDVSRTSIRAALCILHEQGLVVARQNRGYTLAHRLDEIEIATELPTSADETLYMRIARDRVLNLLPESTTETDLMRRYDCGRNLVLTALAILSEEGLVHRGRGREWRFRKVLNSPQARRQSYELRLMLEPAALLLPGFAPDKRELEAMRGRQLALLTAAGRPSSWRDVFDIDASFHELLARFSGNEFVLEVICQQNRLRRLMEYESYPDAARVRAWSREHVAVIDAVLAGERELASRRLAQHLRNAMPLTASFEAANGRKPPRTAKASVQAAIAPDS